MAPRRLRGRLIALDGFVLSVARIVSPALWGLVYDQRPATAMALASWAAVLAATVMALQREAVKKL